MYQALDIIFVVVHGAIVLFNLFGWIPRSTRRVHLWVISATLASWSVLGIFFGLGYCPFTDWHWDVKRALGERDLPSSYVKYYLDRATGLDWDPSTVDVVVLISAVVPFGLSVWLNLRDRRKRLSTAPATSLHAAGRESDSD